MHFPPRVPAGPVILRPVIRSSNKRRLVVALVCVALVAMRIGGAHLHLCLDGSEPPITLHMSDSGLHHTDEPAGITHSDQEVLIGADALVKKSFSDFELPLIAFAFVLLLFMFARTRDLLPDFFAPPRLSPARAHLRPPLRGPPR
jgi:hypothetical protein